MMNYLGFFSVMFMIHFTIIFGHIPSQLVIGRIKRLEKLHKAIEEEIKVLKIRTSAVFGENGGFVGGSSFENTGGAANYVCLPVNPEWSDKALNATKKGKTVAFVYGTEYLFGNENKDFFGKHITSDDNIPCAVCATRSTNILMIPGKISCFDGWKREYTGYLVAGHPMDTSASEYVCMDENPEVVKGSFPLEARNVFTLAVSKCGDLACPP